MPTNGRWDLIRRLKVNAFSTKNICFKLQYNISSGERNDTAYKGTVKKK